MSNRRKPKSTFKRTDLLLARDRASMTGLLATLRCPDRKAVSGARWTDAHDFNHVQVEHEAHCPFTDGTTSW